MKDNKMFKVYFAAIASSSIIGLSYLFSKIGLQHSSPLDLLAYRFTFAFAAVLIGIMLNLIKTTVNKQLIKKLISFISILLLFYRVLFMLFGKKSRPFLYFQNFIFKEIVRAFIIHFSVFGCLKVNIKSIKNLKVIFNLEYNFGFSKKLKMHGRISKVGKMKKKAQVTSIKKG